MKTKQLQLILVIIILLFCFCLLKNIAYPLFWHDEGETVMFGERIFKYGYPKVFDGKNYVSTATSKLGVHEKSGAYLWSGWTQFYLAAVGTALANVTDDLYLKTALVRIPFALIGLAGVILFGLTAASVFKNKTEKLTFLILFAFFEILSISLILHLKEARYYSILIFLSACIFHVYLNDKINFRTLISLLLLLFNTFYPAYFVFIIAFIIHKKKVAVPFIISLVSIIPFSLFFRTFQIGSYLSNKFNFGFNNYTGHLIRIFLYFKNYEFLYLAICLKVLIIISILLLKNKKLNLIKDKKLQLSNLLTLFFITYILLVARNPIYHVRYFVVLLPILNIIILLDFFSLLEFLRTSFLLTLVGIVFFVNLFNFIGPISGYFYEIFHQYQGPLDYLIPFIKENYKDTQNLVIATNYEEFSYMYYLKSKTIIGFIKHRLKEDQKEIPDIIVYRKGWKKSRGIFNSFLKKADYTKAAFPVYDSIANNLPDLEYHRFKTRLAHHDNEKTDIYLKLEQQKLCSRQF